MLIFQKSICCFFCLISSQNAAPDSFHLFCLFKTPASSFPFLCLSPSFLPPHFLQSRPLPPHSPFHTISRAVFRRHLSFFLSFSHASPGYEGIVFCVWQSGGLGAGGRGRRGERKSLMFVIKTTDCLIAVQSL